MPGNPNVRRVGSTTQIPAANMILRGRDRSSLAANVTQSADTDRSSSSSVVGTLSGDVQGSIGANTVHDISDLHQFVQAPIGYATGGNVQIRFDLGSFDDIGLTVNVSFSPTGSNAMSAGKQQRLILRNTTGAPLTAAYNASWRGVSQLPTSLPAGAVYTLFLSCTGTLENTISAVMVNGVAVSAIGVPTTGNLHSRLRKAIPGTIASNGDMVWTRNSVFSIEDYGAVPNSSSPTDASNNVACFAGAVTDALLVGGTVYFPDGEWYFDSTPSIAFGAANRLTVRGNGRFSSRIVLTNSGTTGLFADLSNAGLTNIFNHIEVCDLGFRTVAGVVGVAAVKITYGSGLGISTNPRYNQGSTVHDIDIDSNDSESGGYEYGIYMLNCWACTVFNINANGGSGWTTATPGAGGGGAGSGACITIEGATNQLITNIYGQTWSQFLRVWPLGGTGGTGLPPQGTMFNTVDCVNCMEFLHTYQNAGGGGVDWVTLVNFQCDNGNSSQANHRGLVLEGGGNGYFAGGYFLVDGGIDHIYLSNFSGGQFDSIKCEGHGSAITGKALYLTSTSNGNIFDKCVYDGKAIQLDALAGINQINNTGASAVTDLGALNQFSTSIF